MKYFFYEGCIGMYYFSKVLVFQAIKKGARLVLPLQRLTVWTRIGMAKAGIAWL